MLKANIRIIIVLLIQIIFMIILDVFEFLNYILGLSIWNGDIPMVPYWVKWLLDEGKTIRSFREIRVFVDAIVILIFVTGYRENLANAFFWIWKNTYDKIRKMFFH